MNKLMTFAAVGALALAAYADRTVADIRKGLDDAHNDVATGKVSRTARPMLSYWKTLTDAEIRAYCADVAAYAAENPRKEGARYNGRVYDYACPHGFFIIDAMNGARYDAVRAEYDAAFAAAGFVRFLLPLTKWPKCNEEFVVRAGFASGRPVFMRLYREALAAGSDRLEIETLADRLAYFAELVAYGRTDVGTTFCHMGFSFADRMKKSLNGVVLRHVKRTLRSRGKSFVSVDGVNPVEQPVTQFAAALDAPRFAGLKEWCDEWCPDASQAAVQLAAALPPAGEVATLKEKVLYGDVAFSSENKLWLLLCLGVDGYNAFVREYNGGVDAAEAVATATATAGK